MLFEIVNYSFPIILEYVTTSSCFPIDSLSFPYYLLNCSLLFPSCFPLISLLIPIISLFFSYSFSIVSPLFPLIYSYYIPIISLIVHRVSLAPAMQDHIWTSKRGPRPSVLKQCWLETCFAWQLRARFRHFNFQKWSNELRTTATCAFSTCQLRQSVPKMVRSTSIGLEMCFAEQWRALSQHLNFQKCSEHEVFLKHTMDFAPQWHAIFRLSHDQMAPLPPLSGATKYWKNTVSRLFYLFGHLDLLSTEPFSSDSFSSLTALTTVAASVHKSKVWFLNFFRLFPYSVAIISPFLPYYSLIFRISPLFPYYFPITSLLCLFPYSISVLFSICLFWFRHYFVQIQSLPQLLWPLGDGMKAKPNNRYDLGMLYLLVIHPWELHPNLHYGSSHSL